MKPYSQDVRDRIIEALEADVDTRQEIADTFGVSRSYVQMVWRRWRDTGHRAARVSAPAGVATRDPLARAPTQKCTPAARHASRARNPELN
jgi:transposase